MPYVIDPVVTIGDVNYTGDALNGVQASAGRTNVDEQPRAGFCNVNIIEFDNNVNAIEINQPLVVQVDDSSGTAVTLWTGWVSDITRTIRNFGSIGYATEVRVTAIGSLAKLNRRRVGAGGYAKEFDGDRVYNIVFETAGITWADVVATETWADVNPLQTWSSYDLLIGTIDRPGDFEFTSYSGGAASGLALAQQAAASGLGILYECNCGKINYDAFGARLNRVATEGFVEIDLDAIAANGLTSVSRLSDIINNVEVVYKNDQTETDSDTNSGALYGNFETSIDTLLENQADAIQRVNYYLATRAYPRTTLTSIGLILHLDTVADQLRDDLLGLTISLPIAITGLPDNIYNGQFSGFVEGYTWTINRNELFLTLNVSDYALSQLEMNWLQVPASETWNTITPTLDWANARSVF